MSESSTDSDSASESLATAVRRAEAARVRDLAGGRDRDREIARVRDLEGERGGEREIARVRDLAGERDLERDLERVLERGRDGGGRRTGAM